MSKPSPAPHRPRVLIVDSDASRQLNYEVMLDVLNIECIRALSGEEALNVAKRLSVALALVAADLPGCPAAGLVRDLRRVSRNPALPVLIAGATSGNIGARLQGYEAGAVDFVSCPVEPMALQSKTRVFVDIYRQQQLADMRCAQLQGEVLQLRQQMEQDNMLLQSVSAGILTLDVEGIIRHANAAACQMLDSHIALQGQPFEDYLAQDSAEDAITTAIAHCLNGMTLNFAAMLKGDSRLFTAILTAAPLYRSNGASAGITMVFTDASSCIGSEIDAAAFALPVQ
ncbi:MAG: PAS domain-containing protein [Moraxellaceae bacterium]|nr:PAS domain-containing protein [Moraxellaceae bacterium]